MPQSLGFAHFLGQLDGLGRFLLLVLAVMSIATWYLIPSNALRPWRMPPHVRAPPHETDPPPPRSRPDGAGPARHRRPLRRPLRHRLGDLPRPRQHRHDRP